MEFTPAPSAEIVLAITGEDITELLRLHPEALVAVVCEDHEIHGLQARLCVLTEEPGREVSEFFANSTPAWSYSRAGEWQRVVRDLQDRAAAFSRRWQKAEAALAADKALVKAIDRGDAVRRAADWVHKIRRDWRVEWVERTARLAGIGEVGLIEVGAHGKWARDPDAGRSYGEGRTTATFAWLVEPE